MTSSTTRRPRKRTLRAAVVTAAALTLALSGCSAKNSAKSSASSGSGSHTKGRIAFMMPDLVTPRWDAEDKPVFENEVKKVCTTCKVTYYNAKGDANTQLAQVQAAIANGVDTIVLAPTDKTAAVNMVNLAHKAGVKVISYATTIDSPNIDYLVSTDISKIGAQQAQSLLDGLKAKGITSGKLIEINGDPSDDFGFRYKAGAHSVLDKSKFKIVAEYDTPKWDGTTAQNEMDQAITKVGKNGFTAVYAANDDLAGGVIAAMKNAGINPATRLTTGQDGAQAGLQRIIAGTQYNTINLPIKLFAAKTGDLAAALSKGQAPPAGIINGTGKTPSGHTVKAYLYPTDVITVVNIADMIAPKGFWAKSAICTKAYATACAKAGL